MSIKQPDSWRLTRLHPVLLCSNKLAKSRVTVTVTDRDRLSAFGSESEIGFGFISVVQPSAWMNHRLWWFESCFPIIKWWLVCWNMICYLLINLFSWVIQIFLSLSRNRQKKSDSWFESDSWYIHALVQPRKSRAKQLTEEISISISKDSHDPIPMGYYSTSILRYRLWSWNHASIDKGQNLSLLQGLNSDSLAWEENFVVNSTSLFSITYVFSAMIADSPTNSRTRTMEATIPIPATRRSP